MIIRRLELKDSPFMLEWMHDEYIIQYFNNNFLKMGIDDCNQFIINSQDDNNNKHYAICDNQDEYLGTISLKNIDYKNKHAEYAIVLRRHVVGTGIASLATVEILKIAFEKLELNKVYLCVSSANLRAISFYKKCGMKQEANFKKHIFYNGKYYDLLWFSVFGE